MNFNEFLELIVKEVQKEAGEDCVVSTNEVTKNNGLVLNGLIVKEKNARIAPTIYIEGFYEEYKNGKRIESIINSIMDIYAKEIKKIAQLNISDFEKFDEWKDRILYRLISQKENTDLLKKIPFTPFLDLAIVYYVLVSYTEEGFATFTIQNEHMELCGIDLDTLHKQAKENTEKSLPAKIEDIEDVIAKMMPKFTEVPPVHEMKMFCLSNDKTMFGAITILYDKVLAKFAEKQCSDIIIIPSSVHETLLIRYIESDVYGLSDLIKSVNVDIAKDEVLSDHAYLYTRADGKIHILREESEL